MPVPLLLIGAGLALTRRPRQSAPGAYGDGRGFIDEARERVGQVTDVVKQKLGDASETMQQTVETMRQTVETARQMAEQASERVSGLRSQASQSADGITTKVGDRLSQTAEAARMRAADAASAASEMVSSGYRSGTEAASRAGEQMLQAGQRTQETFIDTVQRHPMIVGAVGLAIGAAIAAALPATRQEEVVFGAAGGAINKKARELASDGFEAAKAAAQDVYRDTVRHAKEQGLSPEGMQEAGKDIGDKVKTVIANATESSGGQSGRSEAASSKTTSNAIT
jgi:hypothetical protein